MGGTVAVPQDTSSSSGCHSKRLYLNFRQPRQMKPGKDCSEHLRHIGVLPNCLSGNVLTRQFASSLARWLWLKKESSSFDLCIGRYTGAAKASPTSSYISLVFSSPLESIASMLLNDFSNLRNNSTRRACAADDKSMLPSAADVPFT